MYILALVVCCLIINDVSLFNTNYYNYCRLLMLVTLCFVSVQNSDDLSEFGK